MKKELPKKYNHLDIEKKWTSFWKENKVYDWDSTRPREETFVVDTPPPTVSGSLHVGHVFSYTHTDLIVRYQRMKGKNIFYPMGWDDNGLPTERRVQNYYRIRCDPKVPYKSDWEPEHDPKDKKEIEHVSRQNFIEACNKLTHKDEEVFKELWSQLALSVDWSLEYATIDKHSRKISQASFLDLVKKGHAFSTESPTMWDIDFQSAIAQAELEDKELDGAYHDIQFKVADSEKTFEISTTRPELLAACIAVVAHPDDERYQPLFGKEAITPIFNMKVPILPADHAEPDKGTGILMVCTFGDIMDVEWWKQSTLPIRQIIGRNGRLLPVTFGEAPFDSLDNEKANKAYKEIEGLYPKQARKKMPEVLGASLIGEIRPTRHPVKFFEKGDRPLEFIPTRQWFVRVMNHKERLIELGKQVTWHPEHMYSRFENWVNGLNQEWCYSRQRFFGVPFPVWYPVKDDGETDYENPIFAKEEDLPVDPLAEAPDSYDESQRDIPGGFTGDPDVMDTWSTSSMTPQIVSHWGINTERHKQLFPMDLRPQGHDIIRTWAFTTIVKSMHHEDSIPWHNICLSGWILDPDRKKMSKSKGNTVTPGHLLEEYSSDGVRYWSARARLGTDTAFDDQVFKVGRKLVTKLFNASRFVLQQFERLEVDPNSYLKNSASEEIDKSFLEELEKVVTFAGKSYENFDYAAALQQTEDLFWDFCDHYLELVKVRAYEDEESPERESALSTLAISLNVFLRLLAPVLPYVTEEVWSCSFGTENNSIHKNNWPTSEEFSNQSKPLEEGLFEVAKKMMSDIRGAKTSAQKSLKWPVEKLEVKASESFINKAKMVESDILRAANCSSSIEPTSLKNSEAIEIVVTLAKENS